MKPSLPKGTRDFNPEQVERRNYLFGIIREAFVRYGYRPIETPAMESLQTLTGKYGEEGDQLLFKILNNGDFLAKADEALLSAKDSQKILPQLSKRGLRYDLTIPFARFVVMQQHLLSFPFKRYQIQPVWRADRPQKGRYQEFFQCDADVIGSASLTYEAELIRLYDEVFTQLKIPVVIHLNNRKILAGVAELCGLKEDFTTMTAAIDKVDKVGWDGVRTELINRGIDAYRADRLVELIDRPNLDTLREKLAGVPEGLAGLEEVDQVMAYLEDKPLGNKLVLDLSLARGLDYYTGCILEVKAKDVAMGSIGGGGRYADLTGVFGLKDMSGVGISFGADRIYDVMETLELFPKQVENYLDVLILALDAEALTGCFHLLRQMREWGVRSDLYPEAAKIQKMMKYADQIRTKHVLFVGEQERQSGQFTLKNMHSGEQQIFDLEGLRKHLKNNMVR